MQFNYILAIAIYLTVVFARATPISKLADEQADAVARRSSNVVGGSGTTTGGNTNTGGTNGGSITGSNSGGGRVNEGVSMSNGNNASIGNSNGANGGIGNNGHTQSQAMVILITGGTGKTGSRLAHQLHERGLTAYITSRSPETVPAPYQGVKFDWSDPSTFENPFKAAADSNEHIDGVYLVAPNLPDAVTAMAPFIDLAVKHGVKRFVLLSATQLNKGDTMMGAIHEYIDKKGLDYCVLRPSWFQENFLMHDYLSLIVKENVIVSAAEDGRVPWISADDIAAAAVEAFTAETIEQRDLYVVGPELLSYDDVAALFTDILGRRITHKRLSEAELKADFIAFGLPEPIATALAFLNTVIASGGEEAVTKAENKYVGKRRLRDLIEANKSSWSN
ncbi:hypothetical protein EYR36_010902 [Pleurotus pulmonarius]|nr:hypothetical protein EYR36_010902 [Pleurotus pulmonarius]